MRTVGVRAALRRARPTASTLLPFASRYALILALAISAHWAGTPTIAAAFDRHPLRPADTSSPRDTLRSFTESIDEAVRDLQAGEPDDVVERSAEGAYETFDFRKLAQSGQVAKKAETLLFLKEILDRIDLPPQDQIPGDDEVADPEKPLTRWTIPGTRITIARIEEGPRTGEFLFTAGTVARLKDFYERARHLPYKPGAAIGIYEDWLNSPGPIVPISWARALPDWSRTNVLGEAVWRWLALAVVSVAAFLVIHLLIRWGRRWDEDPRHAGAIMRLGMPVGVLASVFVLYATRYLLLFGVKFIGGTWTALSLVLWALIFAGIGWLILLVASRIADVINDARQVKEGSIDGQLVRTILRLLSLVFLVFLVIFAADFFGIPLTPVVASLGVGGLAIALAVRPTLENIIGGLTLFADKPVRVGDLFRYGDEIGTVEEIGLRSTRIRTLERSVVSIPNAEFSQMKLDNFAKRDERLFKTVLQLRYETTPEQMRYVLSKLRGMLLGHPKVTPQPARVRFVDFGSFSKDVEIFAYLRCQDQNTFLAIKEDILLRIEDIVNEAGTGFAFPSQTAYFRRDTGIDEERGRDAEKRVEEWRVRGKLPFPEFEQEEEERLEDILDYPPKGSADYEPRAGLSQKKPETEPQASPPAEPKRRGLWPRKPDT